MIFRKRETSDTGSGASGEKRSSSPMMDFWKSLPAFMQALAVLIPVLISTYFIFWPNPKPTLEDTEPQISDIGSHGHEDPAIVQESSEPEQPPPVRTSIATLGFIGGSVEEVEKAYGGGTVAPHGEDYLLSKDVSYVGYTWKSWTYFSPNGSATSLVAVLETEQRSRIGDYGNAFSGYEGDIYTYCQNAFELTKSAISRQLGSPVSPVVSPTKVAMNITEVAGLTGGAGGRCDVPGNSCVMEGWKAGSRARFKADSGRVSLIMDIRASETSNSYHDKSDKKTAGRCELRLEGLF